jgi:hypothetical protein
MVVLVNTSGPCCALKASCKIRYLRPRIFIEGDTTSWFFGQFRPRPKPCSRIFEHTTWHSCFYTPCSIRCFRVCSYSRVISTYGCSGETRYRRSCFRIELDELRIYVFSFLWNNLQYRLHTNTKPACHPNCFDRWNLGLEQFLLNLFKPIHTLSP